MGVAGVTGSSSIMPGGLSQASVGVNSPEGVVTSRFAGDRYVDASGNIYVNPTAKVNTGWQLEQTSPVDSGLVAHYPFNGNANDIVGGYNGTINGGVTLATDRLGNANSAYNFDGAGYGTYIDSNFDLDTTKSFTINMRFNSRDPSIVKYLLSDRSGGDSFVIANNTAGNLQGTIWTGGAPKNFFCGVFTAGTRHMASLTYNEVNNAIYLYLDAVPSTVQYRTIDNKTATLGIGRAVAVSTRAWDGKLDDVRIYNVAKTDGEILALYNYLTKYSH